MARIKYLQKGEKTEPKVISFAKAAQLLSTSMTEPIIASAALV